MDQDRPRGPTIPGLLRDAHESIRPLLDSPAISPGERDRLDALLAEASDRQTSSACQRYDVAALRLLADAGIGLDGADGRLADFRRAMGRLSNLLDPEPFVPLEPTPGELVDFSLNGLRSMAGQAGVGGSLAEQIGLLIGYQEQLRDHLGEAPAPATIPLPPLRAAAPAGSRIVLASPSGELFERGAAPDQLWPTTNPLGAVNWPDLPTALAAVSGPGYRKSYARAKGAGYVLKRAVVAVEDLADGEIERAIGELAGGQAVAG